MVKAVKASTRWFVAHKDMIAAVASGALYGCALLVLIWLASYGIHAIAGDSRGTAILLSASALAAVWALILVPLRVLR